MIDDLELRQIFKAESEEHLQTLENGLLRLEAEPRDGAVLEELFRSAHSLKGAARMLGIDSVETLAHHFEDELGAARRGHLAMSSATADRLYRGLDAMRQLAREAGGGEVAQVDVPHVLAQLRGEALPALLEPADGHTDSSLSHQELGSVPASAVAENSLANRCADTMSPPLAPTLKGAPIQQEPDRSTGPSAPTVAVRAAAAVPPPAREAVTGKQVSAADEPRAIISELPTVVDEAQAFVPSTAYKIETIRVEPQKLDALMSLAGEMAVTTARAARAMAALEDLVVLQEEWSRDITAVRSLHSVVSKDLSKGAGGGGRSRLDHFHERETERVERLARLLDQLERTSDEAITRLGLVAGEMDEAIGEMRQLPFSTIFNLFPRLVRDMSLEQEKEVRLVVDGGTVTADKHLLEAMKDPLMHMLRNAIDHGIELPEERILLGKPRAATIRLRAYQSATTVVIEIADDGRGLDEELIRRSALQKRLHTATEIAMLTQNEVKGLIFAPGFSTSALITDVSGRGVGLDVVRTNVERLKGTIAVESVPGLGCTFRLQAPVTLATSRVLLVQVSRRSYALPVESVQSLSLVSPHSVFSIEGRPTIRQNDQPIAAARLADLLELSSIHIAEPNAKETHLLQPCILLSVGNERLALFVDALLDEQEVVLKRLGGVLQRVRNVSAATILSTGEICMVLNPSDLIESARNRRIASGAVEQSKDAVRKKVLLLAEDSITTRTQEKRILESAGYEVVTAVDGADAFDKLGSRLFDAVISDIEMPKVDGLTLTLRIRQDAKYMEMPIILVTSLATDEDRQRGIEAGANAYITKGTFEQKVLLDTLRRLV